MISTLLRTLISIDFFTVPAVMFKVLFVFVVPAHGRRRVVQFNEWFQCVQP